jgi:hypothetical protein
MNSEEDINIQPKVDDAHGYEGGTNIFFKRTEQTEQGHEDDNDGIKCRCSL